MQNVESDKFIEIKDIEYLGVYVSEYNFIYHPKIYYKELDKIKYLECSDSYLVFNSIGDKIPFDCEINTYDPKIKIIGEHIVINTTALISGVLFLAIFEEVFNIQL